MGEAGRRAGIEGIKRLRCDIYMHQLPIMNVLVLYHKHVLMKNRSLNRSLFLAFKIFVFRINYSKQAESPFV